MSKIPINLNHFLADPRGLNHVELQKHLDCCLDPLPGLPCSGQAELTMPPLQKAASYRPAAILVPLLRVQFDWHILMTKRAAHLAHHAGQISFPGGKMEPFDASPVEAALREALEEVQLAPGLVKVVGLLDRVLSPAGFLVQPVVGIVRGENALDHLVLDPAEVDLIFTLPLKHLADPDNFCLVRRKTDGRPNDYWVVKHDKHLIWGLSARVLDDLRRRVNKVV
ncbi:CoA pyrophosphatase [Candidatus Puniceispirillum sp.]|nr:CoA pyrophosphatase [Candidatus Puniceispirillum sp.]